MRACQKPKMEIAKETVGSRKVKKVPKTIPMSAGLAEAQNGDTSEEAGVGGKVKKSRKQSMKAEASRGRQAESYLRGHGKCQS